MTIRPKQGAGGYWRWHLVEGKITLTYSTKRYGTKQEAIDAGRHAMGSRVYLETDDGVLFAGERDFSN